MLEEYNFANAKRAKDIPHLATLQEQQAGKTSINLIIDDDVLASFRHKAEQKGIDYQALINSTLKTVAKQFF
jgi:predicted DNA binding CopG/RHH family protein